MDAMREHKEIKDSKESKNKIRWGTVVTSRVRLARNIDGLPFPLSLPDARKRSKVVDIVDEAIKSMAGYTFQKIIPRDLTEEVHTYWQEEGLLHSAGDAVQKEDALFYDEEKKIAITVNSCDHIRISAIRAGLSLGQALKDALAVERLLGEKIDFAKSGDTFLTSNVMDLPYGLKMSVRLNLINNFRMKKMDDVKTYLTRKGLAITESFPQVSDEDYPAGCFFDISVGGMTEMTDLPKKSPIEMLDEFEEVCIYLDEDEKESLRMILGINADTVKNSVVRAFNIMKLSLLLSEREVIDITSDLRVGFMMRRVKGLDFQTLYKLLVTAQDGHVSRSARMREWESSKRSYTVINILSAMDKFRAILTQEQLVKVELTKQN